MASVDLLLSGPQVAQPVDLVFGLTDVTPPDFVITLAGTLPAMTVSMRASPPDNATLTATLPALKATISAVQVIEETITGTLPALKVAMSTTTSTPATLSGTLPALKATISVVQVVEEMITGSLPDMTAHLSALYISDTQRPTVSARHGAWRQAVDTASTVEQPMPRAESLAPAVAGQWASGAATPAGFQSLLPKTFMAEPVSTAAVHKSAALLQARQANPFANLSRANRPQSRTSHREALSVGSGARTSFYERIRAPRPQIATKARNATAMTMQRSSNVGVARTIERGWGTRWRIAMVPRAGKSSAVVPVPPPPGCYTPPPGGAVPLVFFDKTNGPNLVFICEGRVTPTIVVPIKRVYLVINTSSLHRVDTGQQLPAFSMSLSLDVDSWTWGFTAAMPYSALPLLGRQSDGSPAELAAIINGAEYRVIFEKYTTTRQFGSMPVLAITCRGKQALLDAPYAPVTTFINAADINANQLMLQALTLNNVSLGWDVDFQLEDWLVPAHQFALTGSYMGAVTQIAAAAGGYIQPSPVDQTLRALSRYPSAPWNWQDANIDYELPSSVTTVEGIEYREKVVYNHVYVSGTSAGVTGSVKRAGTAGDMEMPMITDALIGDAVAARQRGRVALSDTGKQEIVNLTLPVLSETGIILPGNMVRYVDSEANKTRVGIVRSMSAAVSQSNLAETWQTIGVETHVD